MVESAHLSKVLRDAMKAGKSALGAKESIAALKGSKAVLCTRSIPPRLGLKLREEAVKLGVPVVEIPQTSAELSKLVGRPFRVSAIALRGISDADVKQLMR